MNRANAFTLIELLVVIAIIAILIGIVRPMLSASASKTRLLECESNLRHISVAMQAYTEDHSAFPARLGQLDYLLQDHYLLNCASTSRPYYYRAPAANVSRRELVAACVNPQSRIRKWPHRQGEFCVTLDAGGSVQRLRRSGP